MIRLESDAAVALLAQSHQERQLDALRELYRGKRFELHRLKSAAIERESFAAGLRDSIRKKRLAIDALERNIQDMSRLLESKAAQVSYEDDYRQRQSYYIQAAEQADPAAGCPETFPSMRQRYKGVIVAPDGLRFQGGRIAEMLNGLAEDGFLCFSFQADVDGAEACLAEGCVAYNDEAFLLRWLKERGIAPTILCTWVLQAAWFDLLASRTIWYDICEHEDLLWGADASARLKHYELLKEARLVTYSDRKWRKYTVARQDAVALESGNLMRQLPSVSACLEVRDHAE
ncbi:hypothetical protein ACF3MZ_22010 [Paenibacillaceae bacterium WGS1546]|uniref:hypothetical protein n=1 Tax=Cohnella sp. WGS1546 TaxID=3366810 RepID=UPI00372D28E5